MWDTYSTIFERLGLKTVVIESDNGYIGGDYCHEFVVESEAGESRFLTTEDRSYAAHEEVAVFKREMMNEDEKLMPMEVKDAPRGPSIADGVKLYDKPAWRQIKTVVYVADKNEKILAVLRGDLDVNEVKLKHALKCQSLRPATVEEIAELGSVVGFVSPLKLKVRKVGDLSLKTVHNLYTGADANQKDTLNVNFERDFKVDIMADIALPPPDAHSVDGKKMLEGKGIEVGNIFQLGTHYTTLMKGALFTDQDGIEKPYYMGCYGIGIGRTLATVVEVYHDEKGIVWPKAIAPYQVHLVGLGKDEAVIKACDKLYDQLIQGGVEVLYDDRDKSAGVKLADADLIGIPVRLLLSSRTLENNTVEWKERSLTEAEMVSLTEIEKKVKVYYS